MQTKKSTEMKSGHTALHHYIQDDLTLKLNTLHPFRNSTKDKVSRKLFSTPLIVNFVVNSVGNAKMPLLYISVTL